MDSIQHVLAHDTFDQLTNLDAILVRKNRETGVIVGVEIDAQVFAFEGHALGGLLARRVALRERDLAARQVLDLSSLGVTWRTLAVAIGARRVL